jgi:hypothetical protein
MGIHPITSRCRDAHDIANKISNPLAIYAKIGVPRCNLRPGYFDFFRNFGTCIALFDGASLALHNCGNAERARGGKVGAMCLKVVRIEQLASAESLRQCDGIAGVSVLYCILGSHTCS